MEHGISETAASAGWSGSSASSSGELRLERVNAFSDGVFAIIITIMVLELKKPEEASVKALLQLWPTWVSYIASYLFTAIVWINHHFLLKKEMAASARLIWANFGHMFAVSLIPFITSWMADTRLAPLPVALYAFDFFLVNVTYIGLIYECGAGGRMRSRSFATLVLFLLAMGLAFWQPLVGFSIVCACLVLYLRPEIKDQPQHTRRSGRRRSYHRQGHHRFN